MVAIIVTREYEVKAHALNRTIIPRIRNHILNPFIPWIILIVGRHIVKSGILLHSFYYRPIINITIKN